jgi:hypothetical protein
MDTAVAHQASGAQLETDYNVESGPNGRTEVYVISIPVWTLVLLHSGHCVTVPSDGTLTECHSGPPAAAWNPQAKHREWGWCSSTMREYNTQGIHSRFPVRNGTVTKRGQPIQQREGGREHERSLGSDCERSSAGVSQRIVRLFGRGGATPSTQQSVVRDDL